MEPPRNENVELVKELDAATLDLLLYKLEVERMQQYYQKRLEEIAKQKKVTTDGSKMDH